MSSDSNDVTDQAKQLMENIPSIASDELVVVSQVGETRKVSKLSKYYIEMLTQEIEE